MKFYVIPPTSAMDLALMGDSIYVLAHLYMQNKDYRNFILDRKRAGWYITLDNSAAEKSLVTEDALMVITAELEPDEVIAPDILLNSDETLKALDSFIEQMDKAKLLNKVKIFAVPQGKSTTEWIECYREMLDNKNVSVLGLSKIAIPYCFFDKTKGDKSIMEARQKCVNWLYNAELITKPIHCLGMGDPREYRAYKNIPLVRSTDSCYSVLAAQNNIRFGDNLFERVPTPRSYFDSTLDIYQRARAEGNILWMKKELH